MFFVFDLYFWEYQFELNNKSSFFKKTILLILIMKILLSTLISVTHIVNKNSVNDT